MRQHAPPYEVAAAVLISIVRIVGGIAVVAVGRAEPKAEGKSGREAKSVVMKATESAVKTTPVEAASGRGFAGNQDRGHRDRCQHHRDVTQHALPLDRAHVDRPRRRANLERVFDEGQASSLTSARLGFGAITVQSQFRSELNRNGHSRILDPKAREPLPRLQPHEIQIKENNN